MSAEESASRTTDSEDARTVSADGPEEERPEDEIESEGEDAVAEKEQEEPQAAMAPEALQAELDQARSEATANYDRYLRAVAELDNFRKRTAKMRTEARDDALREILLRIAPVLDNMTRALAQERPEAETLRQGIELIRGQLVEVLEAHGLKAIEAVGQPFDPNLHEAMMEIESDDHPPGTVVEETEKGYTLSKKVVRPARVIVSRPKQ